LQGKEFDCKRILDVYKNAIRSARPDFVLTVNHLGFDHEGMVTGLLNSLSLPFASWYVDSPHLILRHYVNNISPYLTIFLWDEDYLSILRNLGFDSVEYLPLGTDDSIFKPLTSSSFKMKKLKSDICFVGNSMVKKTRSKLNKCGVNGDLKKYFYDVSTSYLESEHLIVRELLKEQYPNLYDEILTYPDANALGYETAVTWYATLKYREKLVKKLKNFKPTVVGDSGWSEMLGNEFSIIREMNYYDDLPAFYNVNKLHFNATSRQMKQGVNQRIFDVPACKGVLITDWTRQLENLMEPDREIVAYKNADEIPDLVDKLIKDDPLRKSLGEDGYRRIKEEHTYSHRLEKLIDVMKDRYR
jgi:spore maturation protein CgeB